jgi:hypothetical protein
MFRIYAELIKQYRKLAFIDINIGPNIVSDYLCYYLGCYLSVTGKRFSIFKINIQLFILLNNMYLFSLTKTNN